MKRLTLLGFALLMIIPIWLLADNFQLRDAEKVDWKTFDNIVDQTKEADKYMKRGYYKKEAQKYYEWSNESVTKLFKVGKKYWITRDCPLELAKKANELYYFIAACSGSYYKVNVVIPFPFESKQILLQKDIPIGTRLTGIIQVNSIKKAKGEPRSAGSIGITFLEPKIEYEPNKADLDPETGLITIKKMKQCTNVSQCTDVTYQCCSCTSGGGGEFGINRKYVYYWFKHYAKKDCRDVICKTVYLCYGEVRCIKNQCKYVPEGYKEE